MKKGTIAAVVILSAAAVTGIVLATLAYIKVNDHTTTPSDTTRSTHLVRFATVLGKDSHGLYGTLNKGDLVLVASGDGSPNIYVFDSETLAPDATEVQPFLVTGSDVVSTEGTFADVTWRCLPLHEGETNISTSNISTSNISTSNKVRFMPVVTGDHERWSTPLLQQLGDSDLANIMRQEISTSVGATETVSGLMTAEDKAKLDTIDPYATNRAEAVLVQAFGELEGNLQSVLETLSGQVDDNKPLTQARGPLPTDTAPSGAQWVDTTTGLYYVNASDDPVVPLWKETTAVASTGLQWRFHRVSSQGSAVATADAVPSNSDGLTLAGSSGTGWLVRDFGTSDSSNPIDPIVYQSGSEVFVPNTDFVRMSSINVVNSSNGAHTYTAAVVCSCKGIRETAIRLVHNDGLAFSDVTVLEVSPSTQADPVVDGVTNIEMFSRFTVPALTTMKLRVEQFVTFPDISGFGFAFNETPDNTLYMDVLITRVQ